MDNNNGDHNGRETYLNRSGGYDRIIYILGRIVQGDRYNDTAEGRALILFYKSCAAVCRKVVNVIRNLTKRLQKCKSLSII